MPFQNYFTFKFDLQIFFGFIDYGIRRICNQANPTLHNLTDIKTLWAGMQIYKIDLQVQTCSCLIAYKPFDFVEVFKNAVFNVTSSTLYTLTKSFLVKIWWKNFFMNHFIGSNESGSLRWRVGHFISDFS
jgi:hypothetical protein